MGAGRAARVPIAFAERKLLASVFTPLAVSQEFNVRDKQQCSPN